MPWRARPSSPGRTWCGLSCDGSGPRLTKLSGLWAGRVHALRGERGIAGCHGVDGRVRHPAIHWAHACRPGLLGLGSDECHDRGLQLPLSYKYLSKLRRMNGVYVHVAFESEFVQRGVSPDFPGSGIVAWVLVSFEHGDEHLPPGANFRMRQGAPNRRSNYAVPASRGSSSSTRTSLAFWITPTGRLPGPAAAPCAAKKASTPAGTPASTSATRFSCRSASLSSTVTVLSATPAK